MFALYMISNSHSGLESYVTKSALIAFFRVFPYKLKQLFWILKGFP